MGEFGVSRETIYELIELVQREECLWKNSSNSQLNVEERRRKWECLGPMLGLTAEIAETVFTKMKRKYVRECNKETDLGDSPPPTNRRDWEFLPHLKFLDEGNIRRRRAASTLKPDVLLTTSSQFSTSEAQSSTQRSSTDDPVCQPFIKLEFPETVVQESIFPQHVQSNGTSPPPLAQPQPQPQSKRPVQSQPQPKIQPQPAIADGQHACGIGIMPVVREVLDANTKLFRMALADRNEIFSKLLTERERNSRHSNLFALLGEIADNLSPEKKANFEKELMELGMKYRFGG